MRRNIGWILIFLVLVGTAVTKEPHIAYEAKVESDQVYDGDTIKDVLVKVFDFNEGGQGKVWAGVLVLDDGVYIQTDIRINGIDTPEKRVSTKNTDGTKRSEDSRARERNAAYASQQALIKLLAENNNRIVVSNPLYGKYAGRTVASVSTGGIDVAEYLIEKGHAKAYEGGTKPKWNWGE